jgi:hypothetical protein
VFNIHPPGINFLQKITKLSVPGTENSEQNARQVFNSYKTLPRVLPIPVIGGRLLRVQVRAFRIGGRSFQKLPVTGTFDAGHRRELLRAFVPEGVPVRWPVIGNNSETGPP